MTNITTDQRYEDFVDKGMIYVDNENLPNIVHPGDILEIDNGAIRLSAIECATSIIKCIVEKAGLLMTNSYVTLPNVPLENQQLSLADEEVMKLCIQESVDFLFVSGITSHFALKDIRNLIGPGAECLQIITKIDTAHAVNEIVDLINFSDAICIDCEKLMLELPREKVFLIQKSILAKCSMSGEKYLLSKTSSSSVGKNFVSNLSYFR